jgi:uncharacterized protein (DUF1501 family)
MTPRISGRVGSPSCDDCRRSEAEQRSLAAAPISRRRVLQLGAGAAVSLYAARALPTGDLLAAANAEAAAAPNAPVLVNVFLPGGLDLLDTLVPANDGRYADLRKDVRVTDPIALPGTDVRAHPGLGAGLGGGLAGLYGRGRLGFLPGIDYANPDLSHFNSRHFWESGLISTGPNPGWLGRWIDRHGSADNPFQAISLGSTLSSTLRGTGRPVAAVSSPGDAQAWVPNVWNEWQDRYLQHWSAVAAKTPAGSGPRAVYAAARQSQQVARALAPYVQQDGKADPLASPVAWPAKGGEGDGSTDFSEHLRTLAALIAQPLGIRVATVEARGDFDTHDDQKAVLARDLAQVSVALSAFQADLEARGVADRVLTMVWTEFGRRPQANASGGTDHGAGGLAWVMGARARSGILSPYPDLTAFDREDNLKVTLDFRTLYASVLEQWLGTGADEVLPDAKKVGRLAVVA